MRPLNTAWTWFGRRAEDFVALLLGSMFASFIVQIAFRYLLNLPLGWTVEYVSISWLWGILFGYAFVLRDGDIIRLDLVYNIAPAIVRRVMDVIAGVICAGIFAWSLPKAYEFVTFMQVEKTAFLQLRFDLVFSIYIPFALAVIARSLITVWQAVYRPGRYHGDAAHAGVSPDA